MRFELPVSVFLHVGLLVWATLSIERTKPLKPPEPEPVEVAIISEDGLTRLRQGDRNAKNLEAAAKPPAPDSKALKEPPRPTPPPQAAAPPPPPPPPEPVKPEPPKPDPIAEKLAALPPEPKGPTPEELAQIEAQKKAEAAKKAAEEKKKRDDLKKKQDEARRLAELKRKQEEAKKKAAQQQTDFDAEMQKALLDKAPPKPAAPGGSQVASASKVKGPAAGAPEGRDQVLTASQNALLGTLIKQQVSRCWNINSGAEGIDKVVVKLEVNLRPDGRLAQTPKIINSMPGPLFADTANSAVRAVVQCEPYSFPAELYKGGWDSLVWTFDPRRMF